MRAPEDQGWFGIVDHLGTSERSEGWEFLVDRSDPPFGVVFRLGWSGESSEHLVWPARGLREVELVVLSQAPTASGLRMEAGWTDPATGMSHWRPLEYTADFVRESADGWRLLRLVAQVGSASEQPTPLDFGGDMEWFRLSVLETEREGPLEIGDLRMRGIS